MDENELKLKSLKEKIEMLKSETDDLNRLKIIRTFDNDELMLEYSEYIKEDENRSGLTHSLKKLESKISIIESLTDEKWIASALLEISNEEHKTIDEYKIKFLEKIKNADYKNRIIRSIDRNNTGIVNVLENVKDEKDKAMIIARIADVNIKLKLMEEIKDDRNRSKIIITLDDDNLKSEYISHIEDKVTRAFLIASIKDKNLREKYLKEFENKYTNIDIPDGMTVGMELEFEGENSIDAYQISDILDGWTAKVDMSLQDGTEITTPVLTNSKNDVENLYLVCDILQGIGESVSSRCGGHVHIGANYLRTKDAYRNLIELWSNNEELIYILSNTSGDLTRDGVIEYATPFSERIRNSIEKNNYDDYEELDKNQFIEKIKYTQEFERGKNGRRTSINFLNVNNPYRGINTIEFRLSNGTIDANTWIENANLFGGIIAISQAISDIEEKDEGERTNEEKAILVKFNDLINKEKKNEEKLEILLDLCISQKNREVYTNRYKENSKLLEKDRELKEKMEEFISKEIVKFPIGIELTRRLKNLVNSKNTINVTNINTEISNIRENIQSLEIPLQEIDEGEIGAW